MNTRIVPAVRAALALVFSGALSSATLAQQVPSYAQPQGQSQDVQIRGRIATFNGAYDLTVNDEKGYVDIVHMHQGTIINPTGLTLAPGMIVSILGYNSGSYFEANQIDTPYSFVYGVPYYYGHPWYYYGPTVSLGFFFGNPGWWHGNYFYGGYHYYGGVRVYTNAWSQNVYRGGYYRGHTYVAPASRGGYYHGGYDHGGPPPHR